MLFALRLAFAVAWLFALAAQGARAADAAPDTALRVAVYNVAPYGLIGPDGAISGLSVDLWRRVAEQLHRRYDVTAIDEMDAVLSGLEQGRFDVAIGAITITPERLERVDFSYPAHRSGVAVAFRREAGLFAALSSYASAVLELSSLILVILGGLGLTGLVMWWIERSHDSVRQGAESSVATLRDGLYWAVVTMTTVGYGDKTPKTTGGRILAIGWMLFSLVLVSLLSTSLVSRLTADRVESAAAVERLDLSGLQLAAVAKSSGAEYLDARRLPYARYKDLAEALSAVADGRSTAAVNSVGALQYVIAKRFSKTIEPPRGLLAPAYMGIALARGSALRKPIDQALIRITSSGEWRAWEDRFLAR